MTDTLPDRLATNPKSPFHNAELLARGVGIRFNGAEKTNVDEYCVSEGWCADGREERGPARQPDDHQAERDGRALFPRRGIAKGRPGTCPRPAPPTASPSAGCRSRRRRRGGRPARRRTKITPWITVTQAPSSREVVLHGHDHGRADDRAEHRAEAAQQRHQHDLAGHRRSARRSAWRCRIRATWSPPATPASVADRMKAISL